MSKIIIADGQTDVILDRIDVRDVIDNEHVQDMSTWEESFFFTAFAGKDKAYAEHLIGKNRVLIPDEDGSWRELTIEVSDRFREKGETNVIEVEAHAFYESISTSKVIRPGKTVAQSAEAHAREILSGISRIQVGEVAHTGIRTIDRESFTDPFSALKSLATTFDLELNFRVDVGHYKIVRYVDLIERVGDWRGRYVEFGRDLEGIKRTENTDDIVTALHCVGPEQEDGSRHEIIVEDDDARQRWGYNGEHIIEVYEPDTDDTDMTIDRLEQLGRTELKKRINAIVSYEANITDLEHVPGMSAKKIRFGDTIRIKDVSFNPPLFVEARIYKQSRDIFNPESKVVELGDFREYTVEEVRQNWQSIKEELEEKIRRAEIRAGFGDIKFTIISYKSPLKTAKAGYDSQYNSLYDNPDLEASIRGTLSYAKSNYDAAYNTLINTIDVKADLETLSDADLAEVNALYADYERELAVLKTNFELATDAIGQTKSDRAEDKANDYTDTRLVDINLELDDAQKNIDEARKNLDETNGRLDDAVIDLGEARDNIEDAKGRLADLDTALEDARNQLNDKVDFTDYNARIREITDDMADKVDGEWVDGRLKVEIDGESELIYVKDDIDGMFNNTVSKAKYETDQEGYVERFKDYETNVEQTWDEINARLKSTDYDADQNRLENRLATWEATAEGFEQSVSRLQTGLDGVGRWIKTYRVTTASPQPLTERDGSPLNDMYSYQVSAKVTGTSTNTYILASFKSKVVGGGSYGEGWELDILERNGSGSNHPEFFIDEQGRPSVRLYNHTSTYSVVVTHEKNIGKETATTYTETRVKQLSDEWSTTYIKNDEVIAGIRVGDPNPISGANVEITGDTAIYGELTAPDAVFKKITVDEAYIVNSEIENMTITGTQNTENAIFQRGEFRKIFIDEAEIDKATILDSDLEDVRITGTMTAGEIRGVDIYGGSISSGTSIDVTTDLKVGNNVFIGTTDQNVATKSIIFYSTSANNVHTGISAGYSGSLFPAYSLKLTARNKLLIDSPEIDFSGGNVINFESGSSIDNTEGIARWRQSNTNYIRQDADGSVYLYQNGSVRFSLTERESYKHGFIRSGNVGLKFTNASSTLMQARNYSDAGYADFQARTMYAIEYAPSSTVDLKQDISEWDVDVLDIYRNDITIYDYLLNDEVERGIYKRRQGLVIGGNYNTPEELIEDGRGISLYKFNSWNAKAIQELINVTDELRSELRSPVNKRITDLEVENQILKERVRQLERKIS